MQRIINRGPSNPSIIPFLARLKRVREPVVVPLLRGLVSMLFGKLALSRVKLTKSEQYP